MLQRMKHMLIKEFIQVFRDPKMLRVIFLMPVVQLIVVGYAVTTDVRNVTVGLYDLDHSVESRELASRFLRSGYFEMREAVRNDVRATELLDRGEVRAIIRMDKGFGEDLRAGRTAQLQLLLDGTDSNTAGIVLDYTNRIVDQFSREVLQSRAQRLAGSLRQPGQIEVQRRAWFNENLESRNYYMPGVIAIIVTLISFLLTSMAVVREKEIGTMEQIIVTPITPLEFILGKTAPFALIALMDVLIVTAVGVFWFEVPIRGSVLVLLLATAIYLLTTLGIGLLISTISTTQQQAMMSTFLFYFPAVLLSGFMFPIANMPQIIQWVTYLNPLRYFLVVIRSVFLKGTGLEILWPQFLALAIMGVATFTLAASRFRKTLA
jgi:ABC-2 type transport system permease protein